MDVNSKLLLTSFVFVCGGYEYRKRKYKKEKLV